MNEYVFINLCALNDGSEACGEKMRALILIEKSFFELLPTFHNRLLFNFLRTRLFTMARPQKYRTISDIRPKSNYFVPEGIPAGKIDKVYLTAEEFESMRLRHDLHLKQVDAAAKMGISQTTYSRILNFAYEKLTKALIEGKAIVLQTHRFEEKLCDIKQGPPRARSLTGEKQSVSKPIPHNKQPVLVFKGWGCPDCGFIWNSSDDDEKNPICPSCSASQTYRLIKKLTPDNLA